MVNIAEIQGKLLSLSVELAGGSGSRTLTIQPFGTGQISDAEYTQNPDYYDLFVTQGKISLNSADVLNDVEDSPSGGTKGDAVL